MERLNALGYEVLYFTEPIDEYVATALDTFDEKRFIDVTKEDLRLSEDAEAGVKEDNEKLKEDLKELVTFIQDHLGKEKVERVQLSTRLAQTPCVLVTSKQGWSANMERIMRSQGTYYVVDMHM